MGTNQLQNWRLTVLKTIKMTVGRPPMTTFKMSIWADCAVSGCSPLPLSTKALAHCLSGWGELTFGQEPTLSPLPLASIQNKANFHFHQPGLFIGFWALSSQIPPLVTKGFTSTLDPGFKLRKLTYKVHHHSSLLSFLLRHSAALLEASPQHVHRWVSTQEGNFAVPSISDPFHSIPTSEEYPWVYQLQETPPPLSSPTFLGGSSFPLHLFFNLLETSGNPLPSSWILDTP